MNNTQQAGETARKLFELVPVSVPPVGAGEYSVCYHDDGIADTSSLWEAERGWYNDRYSVTPVTHYLRPYNPTPAPDAVEAFDKEQSLKDAIRDYLYDDLKDQGYSTGSEEDCDKLDREIDRRTVIAIESLAGHAEGQKATVEAKSAGQYQIASDKDPRTVQSSNSESVLETWLKANNSKGFTTGLRPTSHAEGEKGAVGFAEWIPASNPPKECGRYWCYLEEVNDLGISHFQWNVSYSTLHGFQPKDGGRVTHWMELQPPPKK